MLSDESHDLLISLSHAGPRRRQVPIARGGRGRVSVHLRPVSARLVHGWRGEPAGSLARRTARSVVPRVSGGQAGGLGRRPRSPRAAHRIHPEPRRVATA